MRDYSQYAKATPSKKPQSNHNWYNGTQPSPPATTPSYLRPTAASVGHKHKTNNKQQPQQQQPQQQGKPRDTASVGTVATQSSNDHSPRSLNSSAAYPEDIAAANLSPMIQQQQHQAAVLRSAFHNHQQQEPQQHQHLPPPLPSHAKQPLHHRQQQQQQEQQHNQNGTNGKAPTSIPSLTTTASMTMSSSSVVSQSHPAPNTNTKNKSTQQQQMQMQARDEISGGVDARTILSNNNDSNSNAKQMKQKLEQSDATILELRSSVRQLRRQLEKLDGEARQKHNDWVQAKQELKALKQQQQRSANAAGAGATSNDDASTAAQSQHTVQSQQHALAKEERVGELEVQLDRAHAQLLTADMVRKELEDTLEAEQYTWELRVQDQERTIVDLQQELGVLSEDLDLCRRQWKEADEKWARQVALLKQQLTDVTNSTTANVVDGGDNNNDNNKTSFSTDDSNTAQVQTLQHKLRQLEDERNELQTCLDEALLELEAVDAELGSFTPAQVEQLRQDNQRLQQAVEQQRVLQQNQQLQQGDADYDTLEGLQYLYKWLLERSGEEEEKKSDSVPQNSPELLDAIHHVLENIPNLNSSGSNNMKNKYFNTSSDSSRTKDAMAQQLAEMESQLMTYRDDLDAREQSSAELRASLKEAVALIKPLQDAVDEADQQRADLQQEVERLKADHEVETKEMQQELRAAEQALRQKERECENLQSDIQRLQLELRDAKELAQARQAIQGLSPTAAAAAAAAAAHTPPPSQPTQELSSLSKARSDLKAKRAQEQTLRSLLRDAQNRFHTLNQQNEHAHAQNQQLQGRLRDVEEQHSSGGSVGGEFVVDVSAPNIADLEHHVASLKQTLQEKNAELEDLQRNVSQQQSSPEGQQRMKELESKLTKTEQELKEKCQVEKTLNKSLKEALGLLKPLKNHLEEAEAEKKELSKEVRTLRRKLTKMEIGGMDTIVAAFPNNSNSLDRTPVASNANGGLEDERRLRREKEELEETVRHLEQENSQLHDALDEMSRMNNNSGAVSSGNKNNTEATTISPNSKMESRMNQEIVELKSRYEVTQSRLEDAYDENHALVEALKEKEESEKDAIEGMRILREKLRKTELDLENAKYIATSALVKVEQARSEQNGGSSNPFDNESHTVHSLEEKALELDILAAAGMRPAAAGMPPLPPSNHHQQQLFHSLQHQEHPSMQNHRGSQMQQPLYMSPEGIMSNDSSSNSPARSWAGRQSRLADF